MTAAPYPSDTRAKGWRFEVDHERIRQSDTWALASADLRPWLLMLWMVAWEQTPCGSLPPEDDLIAARIGMPLKAFQKARAILLRGWTQADDGRMYHGVVTQRVLEMIAKRAKDAARRATHRGVTSESRVTKPDSDVKDGTKHQAPDTTEAKASAAPAKPPRASRKCPEGFVVTPEMRAKELAAAPGLDIDRETAKFRDHEFAKARSDWAAAWRNWVREAFDRQARKSGSAPVTFRERDHELAAARVHEMTGGLVSAKPITTRRTDALQEVFDATPRLVG